MLNEQSIDWERKIRADVKLGNRRRNQGAVKLAIVYVEGLMALIGILGILATKLLELHAVSRESEEIAAEKIVLDVFLRIIKIKLSLKENVLTLKSF